MLFSYVAVSCATIRIERLERRASLNVRNYYQESV